MAFKIHGLSMAQFLGLTDCYHLVIYLQSVILTLDARRELFCVLHASGNKHSGKYNYHVYLSGT